MSTKICEWKQAIIFKLKINKHQEFWIKVKCAGQEAKKKSDVGAINNEALGLTGWKVCKCEVFSGPYFPTFGLNTDWYYISLRI